MTDEELRAAASGNLRRSGFKNFKILVQVTPPSGWWLVVISEEFEGMPLDRRRQVALEGIPQGELSLVELLTPSEQDWAGKLPAETPSDELPLWPEALDRGERPQDSVPLFPSDIDEDLALPLITTFYSLRGGVGRSTALAYTAQILADRGHNVVCVDLDLEAPGLATLFGKDRELAPGLGVLHLLLALDRGEKPDFTKHLIRIRETVDLYCLPAGMPSSEYARWMQFVDPAAWYREESNPLRQLLAGLREDLPFRPDVILLDARTGISSLSAPLLFDLADLAVVVFFPHPQAEVATAALVRALLAARTHRSRVGEAFTPEPRFLVSPLPASNLPEVERKYKDRALNWIAEWLSHLQPRRRPLLEHDITHFVRYQEQLASSDHVLEHDAIAEIFSPVADWLESFLGSTPERAATPSLSGFKDSILKELRFSSGTAERQEDLRATFVETEAILRALDPQRPLVRGRKGTGKTAIFRWIAEGSGKDSIVVTAPPDLSGNRWWLLRAEGFTEVDRLRESLRYEWRTFWAVYICLACHLGWRDPGRRPSLPDGLPPISAEGSASQLAVVEVLERLLHTKKIGLLADEWLRVLDSEATPQTILLFDGLDTGFGNSPADYERRKQAIEGLFAFITSSGDQLRALKLKVLLREDLWKELEFENKSHFFGRSILLQWKDQASFLRVALKQALRSEGFVSALKKSRGDWASPASFDRWSQQEVFSAWSLLVGERMKGSKTAFTRNWVWNRLADGNEDHSPRYLLQLMNQAVDWERSEHGKNPDDRSVIRPRGLEDVLEQVSEQALQALRDEEFSELRGLMEKLRSIGRTPLDAADLGELDQAMIDLGESVGLLAVYEGVEGQVERYRVPDLFRYGLKMTRKGQR